MAPAPERRARREFRARALKGDPGNGRARRGLRGPRAGIGTAIVRELGPRLFSISGRDCSRSRAGIVLDLRSRLFSISGRNCSRSRAGIVLDLGPRLFASSGRGCSRSRAEIVLDLGPSLFSISGLDCSRSRAGIVLDLGPGKACETLERESGSRRGLREGLPPAPLVSSLPAVRQCALHARFQSVLLSSSSSAQGLPSPFGVPAHAKGYKGRFSRQRIQKSFLYYPLACEGKPYESCFSQ